MKKTLSLLLLLSLVLSLASCRQKTTTDDPVAAATLAESYQSYLDTAEPSYAYDIALELTTNPEYFNAEQGGRNAGSDAEHAAADYLVGVMKDIGLADVEKQAAQCDRWQFNSASLTIDGKELTMNLRQWSDALNGSTVTVNGTDYNFGEGIAEVETRLTILAGIEGKVLETYDYLPMLQDSSMALLSQQVYYVTEDYNPVMEYGGIAYLKYNYTDAEWTAYVAEQGGQLTY